MPRQDAGLGLERPAVNRFARTTRRYGKDGQRTMLRITFSQKKMSMVNKVEKWNGTRTASHTLRNHRENSAKGDPISNTVITVIPSTTRWPSTG
jgi:hypothetical protein